MATSIVSFIARRLVPDDVRRIILVSQRCTGCAEHKREAASARREALRWRQVAERYCDDNDRLRTALELFESRNIRLHPAAEKPSPMPAFTVVGT